MHCAPSERSIADIPGFETRLRECFPHIGVLAKGRNGESSLAHVLEAAALALQEEAGCPVTFSHTEPTMEEGTSFVVVEYGEEDVGRKAIAEARALIDAVIAGAAFDAERAVASLRALDEDIRGQTQILGATFDDVVLFQDACQRGRADGEVLALLREGLQGAARAA